MGTGKGIRAASTGSIEIHFMYRGVRCRERIKLQPTKPNLAYAARLKRQIEDEIARGEFEYRHHFPDSPRAKTLARQPGAAITVAEALGDYLEEAKAWLARSTWLDYRNSIQNHLIPEFGQLQIDELTRARVRSYVKQKQASNKRVRNILGPLRGMLTELVEDEVIDEDPLAEWQPRRRRSTSEAQEDSSNEKIDPFNLDEMRMILKHSAPEHRNLFQFGFWTGLRISEIIALRWGAVQDGVVMIQTVKVRRELKGPKTKRSLRKLLLVTPAAEALLAQRKLTYGRSAWVFLNPEGGAWIDSNQVRKRAWIPALKAAGVRYRYLYQMRHTFASMMLTAGENPNWIATHMGHCNLAMIHKNYGRWIPENDTGAGAKAVALW